MNLIDCTIGQRIQLDRKRTYGEWLGGYEYGTVTALMPPYAIVRWDRHGQEHRVQPCWLTPLHTEHTTKGPTS